MTSRWLGSWSAMLALALVLPAGPSAAGKLKPGVYAHFATTEGRFTVKLYDTQAPRTVENFIGLAEGTKEWKDPRTGEKVKKPYYDGIVFHRVIQGAIIQAGDPTGTGSGGPGYTFDDEFDPALTHSRAGIVSMANSGPNSNGAQFFITLAPLPSLDRKHTIFGEVVEGMDVVKRIGSVKVDPAQNNRPIKDVIIQAVTIERVAGK